MGLAIVWSCHGSALILKSNSLCFPSRQFRIEGSHVSECIRAYSRTRHVIYIRSVPYVYMCSGAFPHFCRCASDVLATCSIPNCVKLHARQTFCLCFKAYVQYVCAITPPIPHFWVSLPDSYLYGCVPSNSSSTRLGNIVLLPHVAHLSDPSYCISLRNLFLAHCLYLYLQFKLWDKSWF